jgi:hypothetical protein
LPVIEHTFQRQVAVEAYVVQDWQARNLVFGSLEAAHIDGADFLRRPFHLMYLTPADHR